MRNFVIICIDCLRYDRLKGNQILTPFLLKLVKEYGEFFNKAYTVAPWTYPATNSILTGLYPHHHKAYQKADYKENVKSPWPSKLNPNVPTIFSELKKLGYFNLGISTIYWALNEKCKYAGCDDIIRSAKQNIFYKNTPAEWVVNNFMKKYNSKIKGKPFFAFLHFMDLHRPYNIDNALDYSTETIELLEGIDEWNIQPYFNNPETLSIFKKNKVKLYDGLLRYLDFQIERLVEFLSKKKIFDNTTIIVTADHGEEFWDHIEFEKIYNTYGKKSNSEPWLVGTGHGHTLFDEIIHVPLLIINPPKQIVKKVKTSLVSTIDIFPTILDFLDIESDFYLDGISLLNGQTNREVLVESVLYGYEKKALIIDDIKCIYSPFENHISFYNLHKDPLELDPIYEMINYQTVEKLKSLYQ